jgi:uncharacterized protein with GYD domain
MSRCARARRGLSATDAIIASIPTVSERREISFAQRPRVHHGHFRSAQPLAIGKRNYKNAKEDMMAHYLLRWQFRESAAKNLVAHPQDRTEQATTLIESFGGKLLSYYFAFGEYDGIGIVDFPDNVSVAACSMSAASTGAFARFETTGLLTAKEAEAAMAKAKGVKSTYRAPNA